MFTDKQISNFSKLIEEKTGIDTGVSEYSKLRELSFNLINDTKSSSIEQLLTLLASKTKSSQLWSEISEVITIGESYFYRDDGQITLLKNVLLPRIIETKKNARNLRILSAGCSSGEEPYTIAMLLTEILGNLKDWEIDIIGMDLNPAAIKKARLGIFRKWSFRNVPNHIQDCYFKAKEDEWVVNPEIQEVVRFFEHNLLADSLPDSSKGIFDADLIICRNVFIYFSKDAIANVLKKFIATLKPNGYLVTGHIELSGQNLVGLKTLQMPDSLIYQKQSEQSNAKEKLSKDKVEKRNLPSLKVAKKEKTYSLQSKKQVKEEVFSNAEELTALYQQGAYEKVISHISKNLNNIDDDNLKLLIEACVNQGQVDLGCKYCTEVIELDDLNPFPYYLLAYLMQENGDTEEAKKLLRKVIYLEPKAVHAYISLGTIYETEGQIEQAKKARKNACNIIENWSPDSKVPYLDEVTAGELISYLKTLSEGA